MKTAATANMPPSADPVKMETAAARIPFQLNFSTKVRVRRPARTAERIKPIPWQISETISARSRFTLVQTVEEDNQPEEENESEKEGKENHENGREGGKGFWRAYETLLERFWRLYRPANRIARQDVIAGKAGLFVGAGVAHIRRGIGEAYDGVGESRIGGVSGGAVWTIVTEIK